MDLGSPGWRLRPWQGSEPGPLLPGGGGGSQGHRPQGLRARAEQGEPPPHQPLRHQLGPEGYEARMGGLSLFTRRTPQVIGWYQLAQEPPCQKQTPHHAGPHSAELCVSPVPLMPQPHPASPAGSCPRPRQPPSLALLWRQAGRPPSTALPTGCQGTGPRPGNEGATPPLWPHPGSGNKVQRRKAIPRQGGGQVPYLLHTVPPTPRPSPTKPELTLQSPSQHHSERGHHLPRVT